MEITGLTDRSSDPAELTYQVDVVGRTVDDVAREFLVDQGLLS